MASEESLTDAEGIRAFLRSLSAHSRREGQRLAGQGALTEFIVKHPGRDYFGIVVDGAPNEVQVFRIGRSGREHWTATCTCFRGPDCAHTAAVLSELLAEHAVAEVRQLSAASAGGARPGRSADKPAVRVEGAGELRRRFLETIDRPLQPEEAMFLSRMELAYARLRAMGQLAPWDVAALAEPLRQALRNSLQLWPSPPANDFLFWLGIAHEVLRHDGKIPKFLEAVTDLTILQHQLAEWERARQIEKWEQSLASFDEQRQAGLPALTQNPADLRLVIGPDAVQLEYRAPGEAAFSSLKGSRLTRVLAELEEERVPLTPEAEFLSQALLELWHTAGLLTWTYRSPHASKLFRRFLRAPLLESRIVTTTGEPLARPTTPLRWDLAPADNKKDDYILRLVQDDGTPVSQILTVLEGRPVLYLTPGAVYQGPPCPTAFLDPTRENHIPAPALERATGVALLDHLGLELPPRIQNRVERLPYQVTIRCELQNERYAIDVEECAVSAAAQAPDGRKMTWTGFAWRPSSSRGGRYKASGNQRIRVYDKAALREAEMLLALLPLKPAYFGNAQVLRVTKKFPEVFAAWLESVPPHIQVELVGELASFSSAAVAGRVKLDVTETEIDWFDLRVILDVADASLTPDEVNLLLKAKGKYVRLQGKGWRRLAFDLSAEENEQLAQLGLSAAHLSAEPQRLHALQLAHPSARRFIADEKFQALSRRASEIQARVAPPVPTAVSAELRPYQVEGFHFLAYLAVNRFGGILADDMGLGKTLQTLTWLVWLRQRAREGGSPDPTLPPSLVVCPKSVMDNWHAEAARFTPQLRVRLWAASELGRLPEEQVAADLHVLNYSQLRSLSEIVKELPWQAVILDEGQYIKNPNSQSAQVARALSAEHRLILSGTPIENRLLDLWSLMHFVMPGVLGNRTQFARLYDAKGDALARKRLAARVRPFLLRRTKSQVAKDLPDRIEEDLFCELEGEQQALYRAELKQAQQLLLGISTQQELAQQQFHFLVSLLRLRQICCDPRLRDPASKAPSTKLEALLDQLEPLMEEGQKVLVFSQFVELLELLRPVLAERGWPFFYLTGATEDRGPLVQKFQTSEGPAVFLISLKAGGFGLNLTAASYVILFDPWWNPAVENQAVDRTHRIGQTNKVIAYRLLIKNSVEEKIRALQKNKSALAEDVLGEERFAQSLTLDDLRFLFSD